MAEENKLDFTPAPGLETKGIKRGWVDDDSQLDGFEYEALAEYSARRDFELKLEEEERKKIEEIEQEGGSSTVYSYMNAISAGLLNDSGIVGGYIKQFVLGRRSDQRRLMDTADSRGKVENLEKDTSEEELVEVFGDQFKGLGAMKLSDAQDIWAYNQTQEEVDKRYQLDMDRFSTAGKVGLFLSRMAPMAYVAIRVEGMLLKGATALTKTSAISKIGQRVTQFSNVISASLKADKATRLAKNAFIAKRAEQARRAYKGLIASKAAKPIAGASKWASGIAVNTGKWVSGAGKIPQAIRAGGVNMLDELLLWKVENRYGREVDLKTNLLIAAVAPGALMGLGLSLYKPYKAIASRIGNRQRWLKVYDHMDSISRRMNGLVSEIKTIKSSKLDPEVKASRIKNAQLRLLELDKRLKKFKLAANIRRLEDHYRKYNLGKPPAEAYTSKTYFDNAGDLKSEFTVPNAKGKPMTIKFEDTPAMKAKREFESAYGLSLIHI